MHGPRVVRLPWAEPGSRFTALFEGIAIAWLKVASQKAVAEQMGLSWDEVHAIQERAVARGMARRREEVVRHLGVDEKSFTRGHRYFTLVNDLDGTRVLFVAEDRSEASLDAFWESLSDEQKTGVEAIAMDMWDPYVSSTRRHLPEADNKIVFDKFHIAKHSPKRWTLSGGGRTNNCVRQATTGWPARATTGCAIPRRWSRPTARSLQRYATAT
jgi:transposase